MDPESESEYIDDNRSLLDFVDDYRELRRHGHSVVGRLVRYGRVWFVKSYDSESLISEIELRLEKEYEVMLKLNHPSIVKAGWLERLPGIGLCMAMEYVDGETLGDYLSHATVNERRRLSMQLIEAVAYLHSQGVCHLDLKPENILVCGHEDHLRLTIVDFGLSDWAGSAIFKSAGGTRTFSAPEQFESGYEATPASDVYSLGLLLRLIGGGGAFSRVARKCAVHDPEKRPADAAVVMREVSTRLRRRRKIKMVLPPVIIICIVAGVYFAISGRKVAEPVDRHDILIAEWKDTMEVRITGMELMARDTSIALPQRLERYQQMYDLLAVDTKVYFKEFLDSVGRDEISRHPVWWCSIGEPEFEPLRQRINATGKALLEEYKRSDDMPVDAVNLPGYVDRRAR